MRTLTKKTFDKNATVKETIIERPKPFVIVEEPVTRQFDQLPEDYQEVCQEEALPLEYVGEDWRTLLVTTNSVMHESGMISGAALRDKWEASSLEKMALSSVKAMKGGWLPVLCPDGRYLAIKILDEAI